LTFWREGVDGRNQVKFSSGPFSIQPIILLIFVTPFLLLEWLLSENAVVENKAEEDEAMSAAVDYATSLTFDN